MCFSNASHATSNGELAYATPNTSEYSITQKCNATALGLRRYIFICGSCPAAWCMTTLGGLPISALNDGGDTVQLIVGYDCESFELQVSTLQLPLVILIEK